MRLRGFVHIAVAVLLAAMAVSYFAVAAVSDEVKAGVVSAGLGGGGLAAIAVAERRRRRLVYYGDVVMVLDEDGLDDRDRAILRLLEAEGPLGVSDVARRLGISKSTASRKLRKLAERGLVSRIVVDGRPLYEARGGAAARLPGRA